MICKFADHHNYFAKLNNSFIMNPLELRNTVIRFKTYVTKAVNKNEKFIKRKQYYLKFLL